MKNIKKVFFLKPVNLFLAIPRDKKQNMYRLSRSGNMTYSCTNNNFKKFAEEGLIDLTRNGREIIVTLTDKGIELQLLLQKIMSIL